MTATLTNNPIAQTFTAILYWEDDVYVAEGDTVEEALANLQEATELYLEEFPMPTVTRRLITTFEVPHAQAAKG